MLVLAAAIAQSLYFYFDFVTPKTPPRCTDHPRRPSIPNPTNAPPTKRKTPGIKNMNQAKSWSWRKKKKKSNHAWMLPLQ
jgi:hypothetical protein